MQKRIREIVDLLNKYAYHYYVLDNPIVSDKTYDDLYSTLVDLERQSGIVLSDSPTLRVGGEPLSGFSRHTHINRLYSLDKCNTFEELTEWIEKTEKVLGSNVEYTLDYKLDGLTICVTYKNGELVSAATRGNGVTGEDVTAQVLTIKSVPLSIPYKGMLEVHGEGIMRLSAFNKYNETALEPLKNPRNGVAGAIKNLDPKVTASRQLDIIFYNINYIDDKGLLKTQSDISDFLHKNCFKTTELFLSNNTKDLIEKIKKVNRDVIDFLIDGMVIKVNDIKARESLGYTDKFPKWAIAYKFEAEEVDTVLENVTWNVGRTGKLTPLASLTPVDIGGVTVKKATLNNYGDILRKKVRIGSTVFIRRSNDVIPEVLGVSDESQLGTKEIAVPFLCPACSSHLVEEGANLFCPNKSDCPPQVYGRIEHFVAKDCMDIEGLSTKTVISLYESLGVRFPSDLYYLTYSKLSVLDGFKDKKIKNLLDAIERSKNAELANFIHALGIPNVGKKLAKDLAKRYKNMDALASESLLNLALIPDIGEITANDIVNYFSINAKLIEDFKKIGINPVYKNSSKGGFFSGKKVVLTGTLISYTRTQAAKIIEENGGEILSNVTKDTDFVLAGEKAGSKLKKAIDLNIKIMNENEFTTAINT